MLTVKNHVITRLAAGDCCADHFVCKWGGGAAPPPPTPRFVEAILAYGIYIYTKRACHRHVPEGG